jgi:hypothetical protein
MQIQPESGSDSYGDDDNSSVSSISEDGIRDIVNFMIIDEHEEYRNANFVYKLRRQTDASVSSDRTLNMFVNLHIIQRPICQAVDVAGIRCRDRFGEGEMRVRRRNNTNQGINYECKRRRKCTGQGSTRGLSSIVPWDLHR